MHCPLFFSFVYFPGIGPYCKAAGITANQLQRNLEGVQVLGVLKNGLVLELYDFFIVGLKYQLKSLVMTLHDLAGCPEADIRVVSSYLWS